MASTSKQQSSKHPSKLMSQAPPPRSTQLLRITYILNTLGWILSLLVITGWYTHNKRLIQVMPSFVSMQFNTALALLLSGLALFSLLRGRRTLTALFATLTFTLSAATLLQYATGLNFHIDEFFVSDFVGVKVTHPGRMSSNTAICYTLMGVALFLARRETFLRTIVVIALSSLVLGISSVSLFGYMSGIEGAFDGWGNLSQMALHTSTGFLILSLAVILRTYALPGYNDGREFWFYLIPVALTLFFAALHLSWALYATETLHIRHEVERATVELSTSLQKTINSRLLPIRRLKQKWAHQNTTPSLKWHQTLTHAIVRFPCFMALAYRNIAKDTTWKLFAQSQKEKQLINQFLRDQHTLLKRAAQTRKELLLSYTPSGKQRRTFVLITSNKHTSKTAHILVSLFDMTRFVDELFRRQKKDFAATISHAQHTLYQSHTHTKPPPSSLSYNINTPLLSTHWNVRVWSLPSLQARFRTSLPWLVLVLMLLVTFLLPTMLSYALRQGHIALQLQQANDALQQETERAEQYAEKLESSNKELEQFAYVSSHDLQEPLRMIVNFGKLIEEEIKGQDELLDEYLFFMIDGGQRMQTLLKELLALSRVSTQGRHFVHTDLNKLVQEVMRDITLALEDSGATYTIETLPTVPVDPGQLRRVFQNLILNALKFCQKDKAPYFAVSATQRESDWLISVQDHGIGIAAKSYKRIFEMFQRLHRREEYPGTGAGLAIAKKIIQRHGGDIWVESTPG
ncbi:MAG TPA: hypothetical protein DCE42_14140, partial [Myxococcales bacterium]|nr:hypothetical protein [Myxococcales bacterium]